MLPAPVIAVLGAAAGALLFNSVQKSKQNALAAEAARQAALNLAVTELTQGKTYAVQLMVTRDIGTKDVPTASAVIKSTMEQLGWKVLSTPAFRDAKADGAAFSAGQPAQWVFSGQWTLADKSMKVSPGWMGSAMAFLLPVA